MNAPRPNPADSFDLDDFFVVAREAGHALKDLPVWACRRAGAVALGDGAGREIERVDIEEVPGAWQLRGVLGDAECDQLVALSEALGYDDDAPVSLPRHILHADNVTWVVDENVDGAIWARCKDFFAASEYSSLRPLGLNPRFRFYRYGSGDYFAPHADGAWPGSRVVDGKLVHDAYGDRLSEMTFLIFLSDGYEGGRTMFRIGDGVLAAVPTPKGAVLCFPHGSRPEHCIHGGEAVEAGRKYIIRTDVLFG